MFQVWAPERSQTQQNWWIVKRRYCSRGSGKQITFLLRRRTHHSVCQENQDSFILQITLLYWGSGAILYFMKHPSRSRNAIKSSSHLRCGHTWGSTLQPGWTGSGPQGSSEGGRAGGRRSRSPWSIRTACRARGSTGCRAERDKEGMRRNL